MFSDRFPHLYKIFSESNDWTRISLHSGAVTVPDLIRDPGYWMGERQERELDQPRTLKFGNSRDRDRTSTWHIFIKSIMLHGSCSMVIWNHWFQLWEPIYVNAVDNIYCVIFSIKFSITERILFLWLHMFSLIATESYLKYDKKVIWNTWLSWLSNRPKLNMF